MATQRVSNPVSCRKNVVRAAALLAALSGSCVALAQNKPAPAKPPAKGPQPVQPMTLIDPARLPDASREEIAMLTGQGGSRAVKDDTKVSVSGEDENAIVDLHVNDEDLGKVLEMLSLQSQKNIVASKNVSARVTANLYNVTFFEALDALLSVNGYVYSQQGNFIYIYTREEWKEIEKATRVRIARTVKLNYMTAVDAAEFVKPLLSPDGGQIKSNGKTGNFPSLGDTPVGGDDFANDALIVIYDFEENVNEIEALLRQIDTRPAQVLVEATVLQTQLTEQNAFGVDFAVLANLEFQEFVGIGGPLAAANALIGGRSTPGGTGPFPADGGGSAISSNIGNVAGPGGLKLGVVSNGASLFLRVLDEVTDTTILSNPKLLVLNRQPARVLVGRKVGYLNTTSTDTATTQTVEFLDTGTQLYVRPFVMGDGMIRMELKPQVSEAVIREATDATGAAVTIPDEITNELATNVVVRDGQTIVLGGLFRESTQSTRRQLPVLGDLPLIGQAFRGNEDETNRSEIIFMITPTKMNDMALADAGTRANAYVDHARTGAREGTLFWSRDKLTAQHNIDAERLAREGKTDEALWYVQRSLSLNSAQPEVVALRERLTGQKSQWPNRSVLDRVIHGEAERRATDASSTSSSIPAGPSSAMADANLDDLTGGQTPPSPQAPAAWTTNTGTTNGAAGNGNTANRNPNPALNSRNGGRTAATSNIGYRYFPVNGAGAAPATRTAKAPLGVPAGFGAYPFVLAGIEASWNAQFSNVSDNMGPGSK